LSSCCLVYLNCTVIGKPTVLHLVLLLLPGHGCKAGEGAEIPGKLPGV
jgi:hypothetical protein